MFISAYHLCGSIDGVRLATCRNSSVSHNSPFPKSNTLQNVWINKIVFNFNNKIMFSEKCTLLHNKKQFPNNLMKLEDSLLCGVPCWEKVIEAVMQHYCLLTFSHEPSFWCHLRVSHLVILNFVEQMFLSCLFYHWGYVNPIYAWAKSNSNTSSFCILLTRYILVIHSVVTKITFGSHIAF